MTDDKAKPSGQTPSSTPSATPSPSMNRRAFLATAGAVVGGSLVGSTGLGGARQRAEAAAHGGAGNRETKESDIKLSQRVFPNASDDYFLYCRQLGLEHLDVVARRQEYADQQSLKDIVKHFKDKGFEVGNLNPLGLGKGRTMLGQDGRDEEIEEFCRVVRDAGAAGFKSLLTGWRPGGIGRAYGIMGDRGYTREAETPIYHYKPEELPELAYDRRYEADEQWEYFEYWCRRVMPVAEDAGVGIGIHPNLGIPEVSGVANLFGSRAGYERAIEIADSPMLGLTLCVGPWGSNPDLYGDPADAAYDFSKQGRVFHVHFRNVSAPLPKFEETFIDNGYIDMSLVMKGLYEGGFNGTMHHDHGPRFVNDHIASGGVGIGSGTSLAYSVGYMRALLRNLENGWRPE